MSPELKPNIDRVALLNKTTNFIGKHSRLNGIAEELAEMANSDAVGAIVEIDVLPVGCTLKEAQDDDIKNAIPMGPAVFNGISKLETGEWQGQFTLTPENVPMPINIEQIITRDPTK